MNVKMYVKVYLFLLRYGSLKLNFLLPKKINMIKDNKKIIKNIIKIMKKWHYFYFVLMR